jgi:multiple sugar transport system substrate-binding protein
MTLNKTMKLLLAGAALTLSGSAALAQTNLRVFVSSQHRPMYGARPSICTRPRTRT